MTDREQFALVAPWIAVFVGLVLVGAFAYLWSLDRHQDEYEKYRAAEYAARAEQEIERTCAGMDAAAYSKCSYKIIEATNEHQRAERDLTAQQDMAIYALLMAVISVITAVITLIGILFVYQTLGETRRAFFFDQRPWLDFTVSEYRISRIKGAALITCEIRVRNIGKSPAFGVRAGSDSIPDGGDLLATAFGAIANVEGNSNEAPIVLMDGDDTIYHQVFIADENMVLVQEDVFKAMHIAIAIVYRSTSTGTEHVTLKTFVLRDEAQYPTTHLSFGQQTFLREQRGYRDYT
ncbi:hypothetical protein [Mesorhizobium sp. Z1-4]|uniref:hypothetical protein n=1 Tax=Mesorhizobium sp. Z1-4 TaxID=2448478 RepID=UPI000FDC4F9E|nr:hypothetical protein [Mesorhizobium sp. Z1-4]